MERVSVAIAGLAALLLSQALAQQSTPPATSKVSDQPPPLTLRTRIPLPGVYGRMDHYGWDSKRGILIVSALGNNTVEIRQTPGSGCTPSRASSIRRPRSICRASTGSRCRANPASCASTMPRATRSSRPWISAPTRTPTTCATIRSRQARLRGAMASAPAARSPCVDPADHGAARGIQARQPSGVVSAGAGGPRIFVNLPDQEAIGVIDRNSGAVTKWKIPGNSNTHALALDEADHRLFTAALQPGRLTVVDSESGGVVADLPCVLGVDDLWFDAAPQAHLRARVRLRSTCSSSRPRSLRRHRARPGRGRSRQHQPPSQDPHPGQPVTCRWPNMLPQGGSEVLLFYVND